MRKRLPIAMAMLVAGNLAIYQHASLRQRDRSIPVCQTPPWRLPNMDHARPLSTQTRAVRIPSYSDVPFVLTGRPSNNVEFVQFLDDRRWANDPPEYTRPDVPPAVLSPLDEQSIQFVALPHRMTLAAPRAQAATYAPPVYLRADEMAQFGPSARVGPPAKTVAREQVSTPRRNFIIRLVHDETAVEKLLLGDFEVPPPPGSQPPPPPRGYDTPLLSNQASTADPSSVQPTEPITTPRTAQNRLRFPDQSPGDHAVDTKEAEPIESRPEAGIKPPAQPPQHSGTLPTPDEVPEPISDLTTPQGAASGPGSPHRFEPAPDENLLRPPVNVRPTPVRERSSGARGSNSHQDMGSSTGREGRESPNSVNQPVATEKDTAPVEQLPPPQRSEEASDTKQDSAAAADSCDDPHYELFAKSQYPSARQCGECHKQIFEEWSVSSHAYAAISPMFHRFEQTLNSLTKGTIGYFCLRCHSPIGTTLSHPREESIWDSIPAAHEGVTCIVCHRVREHYGKVNGDRRIEPGDQFAPVYGSGYGEKLREILAKKEHFKVKTSHDDKGPGQKIHQRVIHFEQISRSDFCVSCHQVTVYPGIALEVVWAQYRASPACKQGISCQDCHMGAVPGQPHGYDTAPVAVIGDKEIDPSRKHSNHMFVGPGYSIAHPGIFPFRANKVEDEDWTPQQWNQFNYRAGWGTEPFEQAVDQGLINAQFPAVWQNADDRADARELLDKNLDKLAWKKELRRQLMEGSSRIYGPYFKRPPRAGKPLKFKYAIKNLNSGHNLPSGSLGAQPQLWVNVALTGPDGHHLWESGYVDCNGDVADVHSLEVARRRIRPDTQLVNFQTKFLITHVKGPDREMYLPVNADLDQLPFIRPAGLPITVLNHPPTIRMEAHSVPPLGTKDAKYHVPGELLHRPGVYRLSIRLRSRAEPIYFMRFCRSTPEMERRMQEHMLDFHETSTTFIVK